MRQTFTTTQNWIIDQINTLVDDQQKEAKAKVKKIERELDKQKIDVSVYENWTKELWGKIENILKS